MRWLPVLTALAMALVVSTASASVGSLAQIPAPGGCYVFGPPDGCTSVPASTGVETVALSPDGKNLYSYSFDDGALGVYRRDPATGVLTSIGCISKDGKAGGAVGACTDARGPAADAQTRSLAVSPDGRFVFVAGESPALISVFGRDAATGALTELSGLAGCVSAGGADAQGNPGVCQADSSLVKSNALAVSPDSKTLYVAQETSTPALVSFAIGDDGALTPLQCFAPSAVAGCLVGSGVGTAAEVAVSPDGRSVYLTGYNAGALAIFSRSADGSLTQAADPNGCVSTDGSGGTCVDGRGVTRPYAVAVSPDGTSVYVGSNGVSTPTGVGGFLAAFARDTTTGALTQLPGTAGCVSDNGASEDVGAPCTDGRDLGDFWDVTVSPDGRSVYGASYEDGSASGHQGVTVFSRAADGSLAQSSGPDGCITLDGKDETGALTCTTGTKVAGPVSAVVSPDNAFLYAAAYDDGAVAAFSRSTEHAPVCSAGSVSTAYGTPVPVRLSCTDANGDPFTYSIVSGPSHGTASPVDGAAGTLTYTPGAGFSGDDALSFRGTDAHGAGAPATFTIHVAPKPAPPPDTTPPTGSIGKVPSSLKTLIRTGRLVVPVTSSEAGTVKLRLLVTRAVAKKLKLRARGKTLSLATGRASFAKAGKRHVTIKVGAKVRHALKRVHKLDARISGTLADRAGNHVAVSRTVHFKH